MPQSIFHFIGRSGRRIGVTIAGGAVLIAGLLGLFLPVLPGWLLIFVGLAILGTEYAWARRALDEAKRRGKQAANRMRLRRARSRGEEPTLDAGERPTPENDEASGTR